MNTIQERLKFERKKRGMTQSEFAEILDMTQANYSQIENAVNGLTVDKLAILKKKLGIDLNYLITGSYDRLDFGVEKMKVSQLKNLNLSIINELESRINEK